MRLGSLALVFLLAGCACTQVGCVNQVEFDLAHDLDPGVVYDVEACVDEECTSAALTVEVATDVLAGKDALTIWIDHDQVVLELPEGDFSGVHDVRVAVRNQGDLLTDYSGAFEFTKTEPNGGLWCGPTCWHATIQAPAVPSP